jgi:hypothetical protein
MTEFGERIEEAIVGGDEEASIPENGLAIPTANNQNNQKMASARMDLIKTEEDEQIKNWLEDALPLDIYVSKSKHLRRLITRLIIEVESVIKVPNRKRYREVLKIVIISIWMGYISGKPVQYSRDRTHYQQSSKYDKLFIKYDRLIPTIDALETLGYIEQKKGFWDRNKHIGRTTRMWATEKLIKAFLKHELKRPGFFEKPRPENPVVLKDDSKKKKEIPYETNSHIQKIREDLEQYNGFVDKNIITVNLDNQVAVNKYFLTKTLFQSLLNGTISVKNVKIVNREQEHNTEHTIHYDNKSSKPTIHTKYTDTTNTITQLFPCESPISLELNNRNDPDKMLFDYLYEMAIPIAIDPDSERQKARLEEIIRLGDIGIEEMNLRLVYEYLYRSFNRKSFELGGRAYGALHQTIPRHLRPYIHINNEPTVELDYSAFHILMLYHQEGIDYPDDPYLVCEGPDKRSIYKTVAVVSINAKNRKQACQGIWGKFMELGIPTPNGKNPYRRLVDKFGEAHQPIAKYLYSDVGITLQNKDSEIMNSILMELMSKDVLGLPIHDSILVAEQHKDYLYQVMMEEYKKKMGFSPRIALKQHHQLSEIF